MIQQSLQTNMEPTTNILTGQYVSFVLCEEEYGVPILSVHEIIRHEQLTCIPYRADYINGVLNLRGQVIPVISLRKKFGMPLRESDNSTRIIVVDIGDRMVGMEVDAVSEVIQLSPDEIDPPPMGNLVQNAFISGMGKTNDHLIILLDLNKILSEEMCLEEING